MQASNWPVLGENRALAVPEDPTYLLTLVQARGLTPLAIRKIVSLCGTPKSFLEAREDQMRQVLGDKVCAAIIALRASWERAETDARATINKHQSAGIAVIGMNDSKYPPLLKLISDPPPVLFVKGSVSLLADSKTVAVVGTRDPTALGSKVVRQIAREFARNGFVIVSGLAKGIDAEAHEGSLVTGGKTVAVLANSLDHVYPKENRPLASRILESEGSLISETPLGGRTFRSGFVQRDRIQSGMSLGVIPVQSDIDGGTMHTVRFAEEQHRLIFCPRPLPEENGMRQYAGIKLLIETGRAEPFGKDEYGRVEASLLKKSAELLGVLEKEKPVEQRIVQDSGVSPTDDLARELELVEEIVGLMKKQGVNKKKLFERIVAQAKGKLFPQKQSGSKTKKQKERNLFSDTQ